METSEQCLQEGGLYLLQLGHAFSRVETIFSALCCACVIQLQLGHAFSRVETCRMIEIVTHLPGFNWATRSHAWKLSGYCFRLRPLLRFNWATRSHAWKLLRAASTAPDAWGDASIGPRVLTRGNEAALRPIENTTAASIGPRVLTRGNLKKYSGDIKFSQLQLGHAFSRVETVRHSSDTPSIWSFNWATRSHAWKPA